MICKNCPLGEITKENNNPIYVFCTVEEDYKDLDYECFFPETIAEKGV